MQNFYKILNIQPSISDADLKKAMHEALRLWSNRTNAPQIERRQEAERMVKLIEDAETVLLNPTKRAEYDRQLKTTPPPTSQSPSDKVTLDSAQDLVAEGRKLLAEGNIGDTLYLATKATEHDGGNPEAWALLGRARFLFGDVEDAIYEYKRAIKLKPNEGVYYSELGDIYNDTAKLDDALTQYKRAAQVEPTEPWYRAQVAHVLRKQDNTAEAVQILEQCVKEKPDVETFRYELAAAYINSSRDCCTFDSETGNSFPTSKAQVLAALEFIHKAEKLNCDDSDLKSDIDRNKQAIRESIQRKYDGSTGAAVVGGVIWFCAYGLGLIFLPFYFYASRPPKYAIYKRAIKQEGTGAQKTFQVAGKVADVIGANENVRGGIGLAVIIGTGLFLPVMAIVNYVKNYTGENDTKDINIDGIVIPKNNLTPSDKLPPVISTATEIPKPIVAQNASLTVSPSIKETNGSRKSAISIPTIFTNKSFRSLMLALISLCIILVFLSSLSRNANLSYRFSLDGNELHNQMPTVQVDGQPFESGNHLKPGSHEISVSLENVEPYKQHFWVFYGNKDLGTLPLESSKGSLSVTVNPSPATVIVQRGGETVNQGTAPLNVEKLTVGTYTLVVKRGDYEETHIATIQRQHLTQTNIDLNLGNVDLSSTPTNAEYEISGNERHWQGKLPAHIDDLPAGDYTLSLRRGDYSEQHSFAVIRQQHLETNVVMNLGIVELSSSPADAEYEISGNGHHWQGKLPAHVEDVPVGDYTLSATRSDWTLDSGISVTRGGITTNVTEFPYGSIEVTSEPTGLVVSTNGVEIGKTPITLQELKPAQYTLTVSDGDNDLMADVNVAQKEAAKHDFVFHYGAVQLSSTPAGAVVIRKGKGIGKTPLTLDHVPAGETTVELRLQDYVSTNVTIQAVEGVTTDLSVKLLNVQYLQDMKKAHDALDAGQFADSQTAIAAALAIETNDPAAIELQGEVTQASAKADEAAKTAQANAKAQMLASLTWLDFQQVIANCTDTKQVQYPVEFNDGYYQDYIDTDGKKKQRFIVTGHHTEMQTRTESTFNPMEFSEKYAGRTFAFSCPGNWSVSVVGKDGSVTLKQGRGLFGSDNIKVTAPVSNPDALKSLQKGQKVRIKGVLTKCEPGNFAQTLYLENAELLDK